MKRVLKIAIPLLLLLAILAGGLWYALFQLELFNDEFFVARAENACAQGQYDNAIQWYQWALKRRDSPETRIAIADTYAQSGNYSRAEYTLACAITEYPEEVSLYQALSRIYVQQDKLLDAENLLSNVTYPSVLEALTADRPDAPVLEPEFGEYDDYIDVVFQFDEGVCYFSTDGSYPSTADAIYDGPFTLSSGLTQIQAIVVTEGGLVSTLTVGSYLVGHVDEEVTFSDPVLESYVRELLGLDTAATIMTSDLWAITDLTVPEDVQSLDDLHWFDALQSLTLCEDRGLSLAPIADVSSLVSLNLSGIAVSSDDLESIGTMSQLTSLNLSGCGLSSVEPLSGLTNLVTLDLSNNSLSNVAALSQLAALQALDLGDNVLSSAEPIGTLTALRELCLSGSPIGSVAPLSTLSGLESLDISDCQLQTIQPLSSLTALKQLNASGNDLLSVDVLSGCTALEELDLSSNQLTAVDGLAQLTALQSLALDSNQLTALPGFSPDCALVYFSATHNLLTDISGLTGLSRLNYVDLDYNQLTSIDALSNCQTLVQVNAFENPLVDVSALTDLGIIVNYSPNFE